VTRRRGSVVDRRIRLLLCVLVLAFAAAFGRAVWLQAVRAEPLAAMAASQHHETVELPAGRGTIFDRMGRPLAIGERAVTVYADPRRVTDPRATAIAAAETLGIDAEELYVRLEAATGSFAYVRRKADPAKADALAKRGLEGLGFYPEERRTYPQRTVASHVLGYAGVDNRGLSGLESSLDDVLRGEPGSQTIVKDALGRAVDVVESTAERPGRDVFLTLDTTIQASAEAILRETVKRWGAQSASAVVLDPRTGAILAMAVAPSFDANRFGDVPPARSRNRAVTDTYEPGSTFKLVTAAGVLSEGLVSPQTPFTLPDSIQVADREIRESHPRPTRTLSVAQILSQSSNVGTITLARLLGEERLARWIERFGFGTPTGVDFPGETPGIVLPVERWSGSSIGNIPIGHGIAVTPVQMAAAYGAVANGGEWVQPHVVDRVVGGKRTRPERRRIVSPEIAATLVTMLRGVVDDAGGTGAAAAIPGYHVAGKTGTAAKPDPSGGYSTSKYVASFVGFVPATAPRLVVLVSIDEPQEIWGGVVAAPAFQEIARFALQYLDVPPDAPLQGP
jgi:cell division protein FtsI (penicillin-binding protein 3)